MHIFYEYIWKSVYYVICSIEHDRQKPLISGVPGCVCIC